jgi:phospholipase C
MPLTMGHYSRADIPFYYSLADAFTVCDQHFCSSLTGTTPNRLHFWTGTIREKADPNVQANVWNEDADYDHEVSWTTFPERLEENGISWKIYQNELSVGVGFNEDEDAWLANFGDNPLEYFKQYNVRLSAAYIANLTKEEARLKEEIKKSEGSDDAQVKSKLAKLQKNLAANQENQAKYTKQKYEQLSQKEKNLHDKAFSTNKHDPAYHELTTLKYDDAGTQREVKVPKGDILHEFRQDVQSGKLPTVSWIVASETFSDHPSSAWYGAWYLSEVIDILTQNPEVWKKTIFILNYDENDGYFDHVPPFVAPHPHKEGTGKVSEGIDTAIEYVTNLNQQSNKESARESSIGLGYRVPLVIASPWSRGGWVCSQVFDLTSPLLFLEKFLSHKTGKQISEPNISTWRRAICGDLSSAFRPWNGEKINKPKFLERDVFIESIHKAKFRKEPSNFKVLSKDEQEAANNDPINSPLLPKQERGTRPSNALPYELYVDGRLDNGKKKFIIRFIVGTDVFGTSTAGSPFLVFAPGKYKRENMKTWSYAVAPGAKLEDSWHLPDFEDGLYHLCVYGPNGFYREFKGSDKGPAIEITALYQGDKRKILNGTLGVDVHNINAGEVSIEITDNAYGNVNRSHKVAPNKFQYLAVNEFDKGKGWYDFSLRVAGYPGFEVRYAGRVETGSPGITDPFMGRVL